MACSIIRNPKTKEVERVLAPNGKESILYQSILKVQPDKEKALEAWAQVYTLSFKAWFGDWETSTITANIKDSVSDSVVYTAVFIDTDELVSNFKPVHKNVQAHHMTIAFKPESIKDLSVGKSEDLEIIGRLITDKVDVLLINSALSTNKFPHITISTAEGVEPFESNSEIENNLDKIQAVALTTITGTVGYFNGKEEVTSRGNGSKVVDQNGEPLLVYHNSPNVFRSFDKRFIGSTTREVSNSEDSELGFFFADKGGRQVLEKNINFSLLGDNVYPVFLSIQNPDRDLYKRISKSPIQTDPETSDPILPGTREDFRKEKESSIKAGKDGVINLHKTGYHYIAYNPGQIKSVFNEGMFSTETDDIYLQAEPQSALPSNKDINDKLEKFLEKIGVSVKKVDVIRDQSGNTLSAVAKASMLNKIIEVVDGKADITTLPEEAAHFFVEMLGESHPLYRQMFSDITSYKLYPVVVEQYRNNPLYRNADGTVNINKIKKEAIGKLIANYIIKQETGTESDKKLTEAYGWWNKLWKFISEFFSKISENPFEESARQILSGTVSELDERNLTEEEFLQTDGNMQMLVDDQAKLKLDNSIDPITKQKRHVYYFDGEKANGSVTSVYVDKWLRKIFRSDNRSEGQKLLDLAKAEFGDLIHEEIQKIIQSWSNPDGSFSAVQKPFASVVAPKVSNALNGYIQTVMKSFPEGTKFMTEVKVYDRKNKIAGSIDLLAIEPDGTVNIYDWKSQEVGKGQTDIKPYKDEMYRIQLKNYRDILQLQYGFTKFGKVRAIPMKTTFAFDKGTISSLKEIEIGDIDANKIPEEKNYLLPVTLKSETTGNEELDALIEKLSGIYDKIQNTKYTKEEVFKKREELARLRTVMRDLHLRQRVNKLIDLGLVEYKKYNKAIENGTLSGKDIMEAGKVLEVFSESGAYLAELMESHLAAAKESNDEKALAAYNDTKVRFNSMRANVEALIKKIERYRDQEASKLAQAEGIENLLHPEAPVGVLNGLFSSLSNITRKGFRTFAALLRRVQNKRDVRFNKMIDEMGEIQKDFFTWASKKGLSAQQGIDMLLNIDEKGNWDGNFLAKYQKEFYTQRDQAIKDLSLKWFEDNVEFDEKKYKAEEARQRELIASIQFAASELENKAIVTKKIEEWIENHSIIYKGKPNGKALANTNNKFLVPKDKWMTKEWNTLNAKGNEPLLAVYNHFQGLIKYSKKLGMLDNFSARFVPSIYATKVDQLVFGDIKGIFSGSGIFENLQVDTDNKYTPQIDPTDGSIINRVPVYFTSDMGVLKDDGSVDYSKKSRDLFKVFAVWGAHMYNYEAMESIEDASMVLLEAERNKKSLVTDRFNNVVLEEGKVKAVNNNDRNAKLLEEFVNYYLYDRMSGNMTDTEFGVGKTKYSLMKTAQAAMRFFSFKTLALNPVSGTAQFVGGTGNAAFMAAKGKNFTPAEWANSLYLTTSQDKKAKAALDFFDVLLEGTSSKKIDNMSLSVGNKILSEDNGYIIQRTMDKAVQYPVAIAMMSRHMLDENSNIVDIEDFVKAKYDYNNSFYNLSAEQRKSTLKKINEEVGKLKKEKSLLAVGVVDDKGKFSIPGLDKESDAYGKFRSKIKGVSKRILGNSTRDDINNIRTSMLGSALMQFRSWIPAMAEERFAGLEYSDELQQYTYGKMNLFFGELFSKRMPTLAKSIITGFGNDAIAAAKEKYQELKREAYEKGQEFNITEGEFIDIYIANLRSEMMELMVILSFAALLMSVVSIGDDDDEDVKGIKKYARRALSKYYNEFAFYYNPVEFTNLVKSPLPVIGLAEDVTRFTTAMGKEFYGAAFDEEVQENAKPSKYFFRMVPVAKEGLLVMATFDDEFRKEWDIRVQ